MHIIYMLPSGRGTKLVFDEKTTCGGLVFVEVWGQRRILSAFHRVYRPPVGSIKEMAKPWFQTNHGCRTKLTTICLPGPVEECARQLGCLAPSEEHVNEASYKSWKLFRHLRLDRFTRDPLFTLCTLIWTTGQYQAREETRVTRGDWKSNHVRWHRLLSECLPLSPIVPTAPVMITDSHYIRVYMYTYKQRAKKKKW